MNDIRVVGSDWDTTMLAALERDPPPARPRADHDQRHLHAAVLLDQVIGADLTAYLHEHGRGYVAHWTGPGDPVTAMASWLAEYYLTMHDVVTLGPSRAVDDWPVVVGRARAAATTHLSLVMQLGYSLLVPIALEEATGRPAYPIVHDRNPFVLRMYAQWLPSGRALLLRDLTGAQVEDCLRHGIVCANLDTAYPGTRATIAVPFLGRTLVMPSGLLARAAATGLEIRAIAAPGARSTVELAVSPPLAGDRQSVAGAYARHFERWIAGNPEQWMAWSSLGGPP